MVNLVIGLVCLSIHPSIQNHISVTIGRNFLILGMMMGYGLRMMPIIFFIRSDIPDSQTKQQDSPCYDKMGAL